MSDNDKGKDKVREGEEKKIQDWTLEDVQEWFKKKCWERRGQHFLEANGNDLVALPKEYFTRTLGDLPGEAVYAAIQEEKNKAAGGSAPPTAEKTAPTGAIEVDPWFDQFKKSWGEACENIQYVPKLIGRMEACRELLNAWWTCFVTTSFERPQDSAIPGPFGAPGIGKTTFCTYAVREIMLNEDLVAQWCDKPEKWSLVSQLREIDSKQLYVGLNLKAHNGLPTTEEQAGAFLGQRVLSSGLQRYGDSVVPPDIDFKKGCLEDVVKFLRRLYQKSQDDTDVPLLIFIDEIDAVTTKEAMKGITTELKALYKRHLILPLVAGNISKLFEAGIRLSAGTHLPIWLQPFSSASDLEMLLQSRLNIQPLRLENISDTQKCLISCTDGQVMLHSELWKAVLQCYFRTSGIMILVMKIVTCLKDFFAKQNQPYEREEIQTFVEEFTENVSSLATAYLSSRFTTNLPKELKEGPAAYMFLSLLYSLSLYETPLPRNCKLLPELVWRLWNCDLDNPVTPIDKSLLELTIQDAEECGLIYTRHVDDRVAILFPDYILLNVQVTQLKPGTVIGKKDYDELLWGVSRWSHLLARAVSCSFGLQPYSPKDLGIHMEREILLSLVLRTLHYRLLIGNSPTLNDILVGCPAPLKALLVTPGVMYFKHKYEANNILGTHDFSCFLGNSTVGFAQNGSGAECADLLIKGTPPSPKPGQQTESFATMEPQTLVVGIDAKDQKDLSAATYASQYNKSVVKNKVAALISIYPHAVPEHTYGNVPSKMEEQLQALNVALSVWKQKHFILRGREILGDGLLSWITSDKQVYRALASLNLLPSLLIPDAIPIPDPPEPRCAATYKTGKRAGEPCTAPAKDGGFCLTHKRARSDALASESGGTDTIFQEFLVVKGQSHSVEFPPAPSSCAACKKEFKDEATLMICLQCGKMVHAACAVAGEGNGGVYCSEACKLMLA